jgi:hypothetical protein
VYVGQLIKVLQSLLAFLERHVAGAAGESITEGTAGPDSK